jgi:ribosome-binding ATPase YchF (GTP1/OBG family)
VIALQKLAVSEGAQYMKLCGKIEAEIAELPEEDRKEFLESLGLSEPGLYVCARKIYQLLGLQTFFTSTPKESRAWTVNEGTHASSAAGIIHTDFEKGFIKAEIYILDDLEKYRSEAALRAAGKIRQEGRDYIVQDGDIIFFKFNV